MSAKIKNYVQFSKKLITCVMIFWGVIRILALIAVWVNPESGTNMAALIQGLDDIAMVNVLAYTGNSVSEKIALGYFQMKSNRPDEESNEDDSDEESELG